jgi:uncharacterized damage-inducible protein DinB
MGNGWRDLAAHHGWATIELSTYCQDLDEVTLKATASGTYGKIIDTLRHLIDAEMSYVYRLTAAWPERPWPYDEAVGIDVLLERASLLAETLAEFLAGDWDDERLGEGRGEEGVLDIRAGVFLAQAIHHANEHRAHVCTILGALGYEPPDVSAWGYAHATGRMTVRAQAQG